MRGVRDNGMIELFGMSFLIAFACAVAVTCAAVISGRSSKR